MIRLRPEVSKNKDGWVLALIGEIGEIIQRRHALRDKTAPYVFHRNGRQVKDFRKAWRTACRKADIPIRDLQLGVKDSRVFHDLQRTTARNLNRAGVPDRIEMGLMGHKTRAMYDRYNIVDEEDIRRSMQQMDRYLAQSGDREPKGLEAFDF
ncbi:MAG TPA: tyrosine-type recombinase/integrase [Candidatus Tectomicrobia bacterium]